MLTQDEYEKRFKENYRIEGFGLGMEIHLPCPFCAAPDFHIYRLDTMQDVMRKETECQACGRAMAAVFGGDGATTTTVRIVQTKGDPSPDYVPIPRADPKGERVYIEKDGEHGD